MHRLRMFVVCALVGFVPASGSAQPARTPGRSPVPVSGSLPGKAPGTGAARLTSVQGNALDSSNAALPDSQVRLRDARYGRVVDTQITDRAGLFAFGAIEPGTYVVELIGKDRKVAAASELLGVGAGEVVSTIVKLPFRVPPFGGVFGHTVQQSLAVMSAAAASGVLATNVAGVDASAR